MMMPFHCRNANAEKRNERLLAILIQILKNLLPSFANAQANMWNGSSFLSLSYSSRSLVRLHKINVIFYNCILVLSQMETFSLQLKQNGFFRKPAYTFRLTLILVFLGSSTQERFWCNHQFLVKNHLSSLFTMKRMNQLGHPFPKTQIYHDEESTPSSCRATMCAA